MPLIQNNPFFKTLDFAFQHTFSAEKTLCVALVTSQFVSAIITPIGILVVGKLAELFKEAVDASDQNPSLLIPWVFVAICLFALLAACRIANEYYSLCLKDCLSLRMRQVALQHAASLNLELMEDPNIQSILQRAQDNPGKLLLKFFTGALSVISSVIRIGGLIGVIFWSAPIWACVIALLLIPTLAANRYLSHINFNLKRNKTTARRWSLYYSNTLTDRDAIPTTLTLDLIPLFMKRFAEKILEINRTMRQFYKLRAGINLILALFVIGLLIGAMFTVGKEATSGSLNIGKFTAFWIACWRLQVALSSLSTAFFHISEVELDIFNIRELLSIENNMPPDGTRQLQSGGGKIELRNLWFTYNGTETSVLKDISLTISQGETIAIVGSNGSGKTTLAKLIAQFYAPTLGEILIDDRPAIEYDRKALYEKISFVAQTPVQFEATARENIAFGDWRTLLGDPTTVQEIANETQVDPLIQKMPEGYNTLLGRLFGKFDLSGGQWQQLTLARALACKPELIILDEPTAALDIHTESELFTNIRNLIHNKTAIIISHRFSTVRMADRIFVLNEGRLIESGSHDELMAHNGAYAVMVNMYESIGAS